MNNKKIEIELTKYYRLVDEVIVFIDEDCKDICNHKYPLKEYMDRYNRIKLYIVKYKLNYSIINLTSDDWSEPFFIKLKNIEFKKKELNEYYRFIDEYEIF